ncbi:MAG TPA: proline iminopeptidase-family hydrolase [Syntrophorhabdaceae bacterium]|jgi:proline iminopeptidase
MKIMEEGFIKVPGGKVWFRIAGASASSLPLLVVHGGPGAPHDYLESLEALSAKRPVIFYDQLGCGNSETPEDLSLFTLSRFVEELSLLRKALGLTRLHILGQSWGSMLVVEYMLTRKPEGVASLVFSGPCLSAQRFITDQRQYLSAFPDSLRRIINRSEATGEFASQAYQDAMKSITELMYAALTHGRKA